MYPAYNADKEMTPSPLLQYHPHPWPYYAPNYSYPLLHACCNHNHACYGAAPYPYPPPPHFHPNVLHPPFPGAYHPAYHFPPPPHYSVDHPRYDYDKNNHHCKDERIKEESQVDSDSSLVPLLLKEKDRPVMWVPRTNTESEAKDKERHSHDPVLVKHLEPSKQGGNEYPVLWVPRGYMTNTESEAKDKEKHSHDPVSVKHLEPSKRDGNGEMAQDEKGNRFPFKIFWLPSKNDQVGNDTKANTHDLVAKKGLPVENTIKNKEGECETSKKHVVQKVIPVKQASTEEERKNPKSVETKMNTGAVENTDDGSRASPKASKLPPVCLRVDPLPRKKKSSRSPSPVAENQRSNGSPVNTPKSSHQEAQVVKRSNEEQAEVNIKTVEQNNVATGKKDESEKGKVEEEKKKNLSEDEAALIIQSACRGFEVRKSQPLKKLRQIYQVKKQVSELRNHIQELNCIDRNKEVIIGETIMSLLLKLDTIQGLHPFVRDVRKSVAKELVGLQERLDSVVKSDAPSDQQIMHPEDEMSDQAQEQTGLSENHEQKPTDDAKFDQEVESGINGEPQVEWHKERSDQASTEPDSVTCENQEVESWHKEGSNQAPIEYNEALGLCENQEESKEGSNANGETQLESYDQPASECGETIGVESSKVEATECDDDAVGWLFENHEADGELQLESMHKEELNEAPTECGIDEAEPQVESMHKEKAIEALVLCDDKQEVEAIKSQEKFDQTAAAAECENTELQMKETESNEGEGVDENEKLRMAMEEQLSVIRELTGRVKDLEKKLSKKHHQKKKKIKVNKGKRSRDYCVVEHKD